VKCSSDMYGCARSTTRWKKRPAITSVSCPW
jgi:hypothetical protein